MLALLPLLLTAPAPAAETWRQPPPEVLEVLHAPDVPTSWTSPDASHVLLLTPVRYPPLADLAADMLPLAGERVDARHGGPHGRTGWTEPRVLRVADGAEAPIALPDDVRVIDVEWTPAGDRVALTLMRDDRITLWLGEPDGTGAEVPDLQLLPMLGAAVQWMPDGRDVLVKAVPAGRGPMPEAPLVPPGPLVRSGDGGTATSTYEARDVLQSAHDEALFEHFATSQLTLVDAKTRKLTPLGPPAIHAGVQPSPNGKYLLVEALQGPWSHRHAWWRFGHTVEVWSKKGEPVHQVAALPLADAVPIHGVPEGPRGVSWRSTAPAQLVWVEALDGGDWSRDVPHRDRLMTQPAPFSKPPVALMDLEHRFSGLWYGSGGTALVQQYERARRWRYVEVVDLDTRTRRPLFDLSVNDAYADPGSPVVRRLDNGHAVLVQDGSAVFFEGRGSSPEGDRPFLDRRDLKTGEVKRLFHSDPERYEAFVAFEDVGAGPFLVRRESPTEPPNLWRVSGGEVAPVTRFEDPVPQLRGIERRIVTYERQDGTPLSFTLYTPPGYEPGTPLPTIVYAYPREFSDPETAGQVRGSEKTFTRFWGASHLFLLLHGYAVLHNTRMPVIGDPDTAYDTFVEQLVSSAEAAIDEAVRLGVTDRERVGVMGHSHGGLMTVTLLAHSDLFQAGIARSGAYNHTIRPFGFQSERRTLWQAPETYAHLSPVMHAPDIDEPLLIIHGAVDENPGTIPFQSDRLFEAVRGTGGTTRLLMLPFEGHGYRARESVEHVLAEQLEWFDRYVKGAE